jgi:hypothetical protein
VTTERTFPGADVPRIPPVSAGSVPPVAPPIAPPAAQPAGPAGHLPPPAGTIVAPVPAGRQIITVRRARVSLTRIDPWSVMKLAFVLSLSLAVVGMVALSVLWWVLNSSGVFDQLNNTLVTITGTETLRVQDVISLQRVVTVGGLLGLIDVVLLTALSTLAAFLFNLSTGVVGGVDVVLTESD